MEGTAIPRGLTRDSGPARLEWRVARVVEVRDETRHARTLVLDVAGWPGHRAGQHVDVRLTAEDGYQAQRSYSIASAPGASQVELTIENLEDGEVSPYLAGELRPGDVFELRGPIGGYFVWHAGISNPLALIAGGSGIVPLMAMLRDRDRTRHAGDPVAPARLLYSVRSADDVIYRDEIPAIAAHEARLEVSFTYTRTQPEGWAGYGRRIDRAMLEEVLWPPAERPLIYVCGPTSMVESAASELVAIGHLPAAIRTERFGPTGRT